MVNMRKPCETDVGSVGAETEGCYGMCRNFPALNAMNLEGRQILDSLEAQIENLQEKFISLLTTEIQKGGIRLENRLHISLSEKGDMIVEGEDEETDTIREIFSQSHLLKKRFKELAHITMLSHGVDVLCQAQEALDEAGEEAAGPVFSHYHAYIKGPLSHFYIK